MVALYRVASDDEAVRLANDTEYGLNASVWTRDVRRGREIAARIQAGTVNVNDGYAAAWGSVAAPMGGMKSSGLGRRHGREGLLKYTETQNITAQHVTASCRCPGCRTSVRPGDDPRRCGSSRRCACRDGAGPTATDVDVDVVVIGSGFGGSVSALRLAEKGYRVLVLEAGRRFEDEDFARDVVGPAQVPLGAPARAVRHPAHPPARGRHRPRRCGRRRWLPQLRLHALRTAGAVLPRRAVGRHHRLAGRARAALRDGEQMLGVVTNPCDGPVEQADATDGRGPRSG